MTTFSASLLNEYRMKDFVEQVTTIDRDLPYDNLFVSDERFYRNPYAQLAVAARETEDIGLATGVTNPYTRNPAFTAAGISTIDEMSDGRAFLGLGAGSPMALDPLGIDQAEPIGAVREAVRVIRQLQDGESVTTERTEFELCDLSLDFTPDRQVPIYVAGRGPQILSLGGHVGDGVIAGAGLTSVEGMEYAMERVAIGAKRGDRDPTDVDVICWAFLSIASDRPTAIDAVTPLVARIVGAVPLDALTAIGVPRAEAKRVKNLDDIDSMSAERLRENVSRRVVEQFSIVGTPEQCRDHIERLLDGGVNHVAVLPFENAENSALGNLKWFSSEVIKEALN
jgi:5,10-methylenetetrahydromethanopterin reductase